MKRALVFVLAGIGSITLLLVLLATLFFVLVASPEGSDFNIQKEIDSPNGAFRATHFVSMGGGAAGWCNEVVTIKPSSVSAEPSGELDRDFKVFSASCGSDVQMRWNDDAELAITFSSTRRTLATSAYFRPENSNGKVRVRFKIDA